MAHSGVNKWVDSSVLFGLMKRIEGSEGRGRGQI